MRSLAPFVLLPTLWLVGCSCDPSTPPPTPAPVDEQQAEAAAPAPPPDWAALRASELLCADCHPDEVEAWARAPMGRSLYRLSPALIAQFGAATVQHPTTGERFLVEPQGESLAFAREGDPAVRADFGIGSGNHTRSFLWLRDGLLRVMPLTWYRSRDDFDLTPGCAIGAHPGFERRVNAECLACHSDPLPTRRGTDDHFGGPPFGPIGCARCHGDARAHAAARERGRDAPVVNPATLPAERAADVCGYCHQQGVARLLREGRGWGDFLPGMVLGEVVAVFARATPGSEAGIASQAERLGRSKCAQVDPAARRCTTCHSAHPAAPITDRSAGCKKCHTPTDHACSGPAGEDCAECHLARAATRDIPHVAMVDHWIRRRIEPLGATADSGPVVWLDRPARVDAGEEALLRARAMAEVARVSLTRADREAALAALKPALEAHPTAAGFADLAGMLRLAGDRAGARAAMEKAVERAPDEVRYAIGLADLRLVDGDLAGATALLDHAEKIAPEASIHLMRAQIALAEGRSLDADTALAAYEKARPGAGDGWSVRGLAALTAGAPALAVEAFQNAVAREPGDAQAWLNLCRTLAGLSRWAEADEACANGQRHAVGTAAIERFAAARARVLFGQGEVGKAAELATAALAAAPADAGLVLGKLALAGQRAADAVKLLDHAVTADPTNADAWQALSEALRSTAQLDLADRAAAQARRLRGDPPPHPATP